MSIVSGSMGAVMSSNAQDDATKAQSQAADKATNTQLQMYNQSREDFKPFSDPSAEAMATLQSGIYGKPMAYVDPSSRLSADETKKVNDNLTAAEFWDAKGRSDLGNMYRQAAGVNSRASNYYHDANGNVTTVAPQSYAEYKPTETEGFKYTKQRTLEDLGRQLRMMGRGSGTVAANATGRTLGDLNAQNEQNYKNDLLNLAKIGQGAAGSTAASNQNAGNSLASLNMAQGNAIAQQGINRANLWAGMGQQSTNAIGNAYQGYKIGQGLGWWGNGAGAATSGAGAAGAAGTAENAEYLMA